MSPTMACYLYKAYSENNITQNIWDTIFCLFQRKLNFLPIHIFSTSSPYYAKNKHGLLKKTSALTSSHFLSTSNLVSFKIIINFW